MFSGPAELQRGCDNASCSSVALCLILNLLFLLGVLLVATEGGLFYLNTNVSQFGLLPKTRCNCRNHRFRFCFRVKVAQLHIQVFYEENWRPRVELHPHINYLR